MERFLINATFWELLPLINRKQLLKGGTYSDLSVMVRRLLECGGYLRPGIYFRKYGIKIACQIMRNAVGLNVGAWTQIWTWGMFVNSNEGICSFLFFLKIKYLFYLKAFLCTSHILYNLSLSAFNQGLILKISAMNKHIKKGRSLNKKDLLLFLENFEKESIFFVIF